MFRVAIPWRLLIAPLFFAATACGDGDCYNPGMLRSAQAQLTLEDNDGTCDCEPEEAEGAEGCVSDNPGLTWVCERRRWRIVEDTSCP